MKYVIGVSVYYEIEAPELSDEDFENGFTEEVVDTFWELSNKNMLSEPELGEIIYIERSK